MLSYLQDLRNLKLGRCHIARSGGNWSRIDIVGIVILALVLGSGLFLQDADQATISAVGGVIGLMTGGWFIWLGLSDVREGETYHDNSIMRHDNSLAFWFGVMVKRFLLGALLICLGAWALL